MRRVLLLLVSMVLALAGVAAVPADAQAADPAITSPAPGGAVAHRFTGPLTVDFTGASAGHYDVEVNCGSGYWWSGSANVDGTSARSWTIPAISGPTTCDVEVHGGEYYDSFAYSSFRVKGPLLTLSDPAISFATFYPKVRDGYRDATRVSFTMNRRAKVVADVLNSEGTRVRSVALGTLGSGRRGWAWSGRNNSGAFVRNGTFRIRVTATDSDGTVRRFARSTTVATGWKTFRRTVRKWGDAGAPAASDGCYVTKDTYNRLSTLDCWGGRFAQVSYFWTIPSNAFNLAWNVNGARSSADFCCQGSITRNGTRLASTRYRVQAKVTGWRAYDVYRVALTYSFRKRI